MPKIRLSALATDIKGKAGGSVFSTNSGGTYFRNNPSGGGRKSEKWDQSKSMLASLSGQWRNLSEEQRISWSAATTNYPTTNAFGEPRTPSGYELFMRLNTPLVNLSLPFQIVPSEPRSLPNYGALELITPDLFLFEVQQGFANFPQAPDKECSTHSDCPEDHQCYRGVCVEINDSPLVINRLTNQSTWAQFVFSAIVNINYQASIVDPLSQPYTIIRSISPGSFFYSIHIVSIDSTHSDVICQFEDSPSPVRVTFTIDHSFDALSCRLLFNINLEFPADSQLYINGILHTPSHSTDGSLFANLNSFPARLASDGLTTNTAMSIQDIRFYDHKLTETDIFHINKGYVLGNETILYDTSYFGLSNEDTCETDENCPPEFSCVDNVCVYFEEDPGFPIAFVNQGTLDQDSTLSAQVIYGLNQIDVPFIRHYSPSIVLTTSNLGLKNARLIVNATAPASNGKNGSYDLFKRIATLVATNNSNFEFGEEYIQTYKYIPFDSAITFRFQTIFTDTGQATPKSGPIKRKPRFKAGADLSKNVN